MSDGTQPLQPAADAAGAGGDRRSSVTTALLTDHYELTMLDAALQSGMAGRACVFEAFARSLPDGRRYGVVAGLGRLIECIEAFRFDETDLAHLERHEVVSPQTLTWLADYRFRGNLHAYREGELYFPDSPVLTVEASFGDAVVLETLVLSVLNHDSAVASAAARMVVAARDRPLLEFGSRRTHEEAATAAARASYLVGFAGTSNLAAGARYGIRTLGTSAHAFTMLHDNETAAFRSQVSALGADTTLLVDTYDIPEGLRRAVEVAGTGLDAVRIDSGDLAFEAKRAREILDGLGARGTRIVASGDLDEYKLAELQGAPIDAYGVGTSVVTGSGHPAGGFVYKLVARATSADGLCEPVAKTGGAKATTGGHKRAVRELADGVAVAEHLLGWEAPAPDGRAVQVRVIDDGEVVHRPGLDEICEHHRRALAELPAEALDVTDGEPAIPTVIHAPGEQEGPA